MIRLLEIEGFKRFEAQSLQFESLTVLAGRNGGGKTSVIHALLLVQHAAIRGDGIAELNGPYGMELGWFQDVVNANSIGNSFSVAMYFDLAKTVKWVFSPGDSDLYASVQGPSNPEDLVGTFAEKASRRFQYLAAERDGPRITQKSAALPVEMLEVGCRGEFTSQLLEKLGSSPVDKLRLVSDAEVPPLLKAQTEQWLSRITHPVEIDTSAFSGTDVVSMAFRSPGGAWARPTNMGFGISYSLPIVLAALTAAPNGLLIVENPEAHLHPSGQSAAGQFLARIAAAGVQVVIETHSDHILNGIRRAVGEERVLPAAKAIVHFFTGADAAVESLSFTDVGGISKWPRGFMDQYPIDVSRITRVRRPR